MFPDHFYEYKGEVSSSSSSSTKRIKTEKEEFSTPTKNDDDQPLSSNDEAKELLQRGAEWVQQKLGLPALPGFLENWIWNVRDDGDRRTLQKINTNVEIKSLAEYLGYKAENPNDGDNVRLPDDAHVATRKKWEQKGEEIIKSWIQKVRVLITTVAMYTSRSPTQYELKNPSDWREMYVKERTSALTEEEITQLYNTWYVEIISMVFSISIYPAIREIERLKTKHNWNGIVNRMNTSNMALLISNPKEMELLAEFIAIGILERKERLVSIQDKAVNDAKVRAFINLHRYMTSGR